VKGGINHRKVTAMSNTISTIGFPREIISRKQAVERCLPSYFTGKPCINGHVSERYTSNKHCIACIATKGPKAHAKRAASGKSAESRRQYRLNNPDRVAAESGWNAARRRAGATLPIDFRTVADLITATIGFYVGAQRATEATRIYHTVDHIVPLSRGGQHHPSNLRVVTGKFNTAKRNRMDAECLEGIMDGTWTEPSDDTTVAMLVRSVAAERHMVVGITGNPVA
jgi:5-methylcytosine-specific restriction endonuclease McrA